MKDKLCGHANQFQVDSYSSCSYYNTVLIDSFKVPSPVSVKFREISLTHLRARLFFAC